MALDVICRFLFKNDLCKFWDELLQISSVNTIFTFYIAYLATSFNYMAMYLTQVRHPRDVLIGRGMDAT